MESNNPDVITITGTPYKKELYELALDMYFVLKMIVADLPKNRDWLDPNLERLANNILIKLQK